MMTKEELKQKINSILSEKERIVADILLENTLPQMQMYYQNRIDELKQRIIEEKVNELNRYEIAITICERRKMNLFEDVLFPINAADVNEKEYFMRENTIAFPIWIEADDKYIEPYVASGISGTIFTDAGEYDAEFRLVKNNTYLDILDKCKLSFAQNGLPWKTVNKAYLQKFFYLEANFEEFQKDRLIIGCSIKEAELKQRIHKNMVPLWNIRYVTIQANDFPVIQENKINYRYDFTVTDKKELVMHRSDGINGYCVRYANRMSFFTDRNDKRQFSFWEIWSYDFGAICNDYAVLTNGVNRKLWAVQETCEMVHSAWELSRKINALSISNQIEYQGYRVLEEYEKLLDYVVAEESDSALGLCNPRSFLELIIKNVDLPQYLYRNTLQYIVDTIQGGFREYVVICKVD